MNRIHLPSTFIPHKKPSAPGSIQPSTSKPPEERFFERSKSSSHVIPAVAARNSDSAKSSEQVWDRQRITRVLLAFALSAGAIATVAISSRHSSDKSIATKADVRKPEVTQPETAQAVLPDIEWPSGPSLLDHLEGGRVAFEQFARIVPEMKDAIRSLAKDFESNPADGSSLQLSLSDIDYKKAKRDAKHLLLDVALNNQVVGATAVLQGESGHRSGAVLDARTILTFMPDNKPIALKAVGSGPRHHLEESWKPGVSTYSSSVYGAHGLEVVYFGKDLFPEQQISVSEKLPAKGDLLVICGSPSGNVTSSSRMRVGAVVTHVDGTGIHIEPLDPAGAGMSGGPVFDGQGHLVGIYVPGREEGILPVSSTFIEQLHL